MAAEIAVARYCNRYPDLAIGPQKGGADLIIAGKKVDVKEVEPHPHHYRLEMHNGTLATGICKICFHIKPHFNSSDFVFNNKKMETGRNIAPLRINGHS